MQIGVLNSLPLWHRDAKKAESDLAPHGDGLLLILVILRILRIFRSLSLHYCLCLISSWLLCGGRRTRHILGKIPVIKLGDPLILRSDALLGPSLNGHALVPVKSLLQPTVL